MATFINQATLSYNGGSTNSNIITGEIVDVLTASKTAVVDTYRTPDKITYVVSLVNTGTTALTGRRSDTCPASSRYPCPRWTG